MCDALDENFALNRRLDAASKMWQIIKTCDEGYLVAMIERKNSLFMRLGQAILFTGYVPLQLLCFMILAGIISKVKKDPLGSITVERLRQNMMNTPLLQTIPWNYTIDWVRFINSDFHLVIKFISQKNPALCREKLQWINMHTKACVSFKIKKCWISFGSEKDLVCGFKQIEVINRALILACRKKLLFSRC